LSNGCNAKPKRTAPTAGGIREVGMQYRPQGRAVRAPRLRRGFAAADLTD
jgi:hypothetical protein